MRILLVIYSLAAGGAERVCVNLAAGWAGRGDEVTVVTLASTAQDFYSLPSSVTRIALDVASESGGLSDAVFANLRRLAGIRKVFRAHKPDVVLAMMTSTNVLAVIAAMGLPVPVVVSERTSLVRQSISSAWRRLRRWSYRNARGVVALTEENAEWLRKDCPGAVVSVIPNPVCWPLPRGQPGVSPQDWIAGDERLVLGVGRLVREKGFDLLIEAFSKCSRDYPNLRLAIVGEGPERDTLRIAAEHAEVGNRLLLPGRAGNVGDWFARAELFVLSSRFEGFPNVLIEAMACGLPVVSFDCETGPRDIIRDGVDGLLVESGGGARALAQAMERLLGDASLRARLAARAADVRERFAMGRVLAMWDEVFSAVGAPVGGKAARSALPESPG